MNLETGVWVNLRTNVRAFRWLVLSACLLIGTAWNAPLASVADNAEIAFDSQLRSGSLQVYVMDSHGSGVTQLTGLSINYDPAWSPDGNMITFVSHRDAGDQEIYKMDSQGLYQTRLTSRPGVDLEPA